MFVECGDNHFNTAIKETLEEAGVVVELKGILMTGTGGWQRIKFYAEPKDPQQRPKTVGDMESVAAAWMSLKELTDKHRFPPPEGLRGPELLDWAQYIEGDGAIYPLSVLATERAPIPIPTATGALPQNHL